MCGGRLNLPEGGNFTSPYYPAAYKDRMECIWTIENPNPPNSTSLIRFAEFALEDHVICDFDRLHFRTGDLVIIMIAVLSYKTRVHISF